MNWLRYCLSFSLLRSSIQAIRGARSTAGKASKATSLPIDLVISESLITGHWSFNIELTSIIIALYIELTYPILSVCVVCIKKKRIPLVYTVDSSVSIPIPTFPSATSFRNLPLFTSTKWLPKKSPLPQRLPRCCWLEQKRHYKRWRCGDRNISMQYTGCGRGEFVRGINYRLR